MGMKKPDADYTRYSRHITRGKRWLALRHVILERDGWQCVICCARGRLEYDHIKSVKTHPGLAYSPGNLQSLCSAYHTKKHLSKWGINPRRKLDLTGKKPYLNCQAAAIYPPNRKENKMFDSVKISRRQSEIRQSLAVLVGKSDASADELRNMESMDFEDKTNETRFRAALIAEYTERKVAGVELDTRAGAEWDNLLVFAT